MKIGKIFQDSFKLYFKNFVTLLIAYILAVFLGAITIGILMPVLMTGFMILFLKLAQGKKAGIGEIFGQFGKFWRITLGTIGIGILTVFGFIFFIIPGLLLAARWMYTILFIADKDLGFEEALAAGKELVAANGFGMHVVFIILAAIFAVLPQIIGNVADIAWVMLLAGLLIWPVSAGIYSIAYLKDSKL